MITYLDDPVELFYVLGSQPIVNLYLVQDYSWLIINLHYFHSIKFITKNLSPQTLWGGFNFKNHLNFTLL